MTRKPASDPGDDPGDENLGDEDGSGGGGDSGDGVDAVSDPSLSSRVDRHAAYNDSTNDAAAGGDSGADSGDGERERGGDLFDSAARRRVADNFYDADAVRDAAAAAEWRRVELPAAAVTSEPDSEPEYDVESWRVLIESDPGSAEGDGETWRVRRVPTAPSAPELHAVTVTRPARDYDALPADATTGDATSDASSGGPRGEYVVRVGALTLRPYALRDAFDEWFNNADAAALTDAQQAAVQRAYQERAVEVFWQHRDAVEFRVDDAYAREPGRDDAGQDAFRRVFDRADADLTGAQLDVLARMQRAARPKGAGGVGVDADYRVKLAFDAVPAFELRAVAAAGQDAAAAARDAARRAALIDAGVPEAAARRVTGAERSLGRSTDADGENGDALGLDGGDGDDDGGDGAGSVRGSGESRR